ncbi:START domain-containing protein [Alcanivorax jadensis]|uniref:START domain-containing protein n=1 Tax=Alcanivorax jadensis TaxID=64988 RepID=UPI0023555F0F|nr:START domain-containing protein [Alcanivorax jadensis]
MRWPHNLLLISLLSVAGLSAQAADPVTRTAMPGPDQFELRAVLPVSLDALLPVLEQPCHVRQWMPGVETLTILKRPSATQTLVYMARQAPWPLSGRDAVTLFERHPGEPVVLTMQGEPEAWPRQPGHVRVPFTEGSWTLQTEPGNGSTRVVYRQRVNPGGGIPQWLADRFAPGHMEAALAALENYVRNPQRTNCTAAEPARNGDG